MFAASFSARTLVPVIRTDDVFFFERAHDLYQLINQCSTSTLLAIRSTRGSLSTAVLLIRTAHSINMRAAALLVTTNRAACVTIRTHVRVIRTGDSSHLLLVWENGKLHQRVGQDSLLALPSGNITHIALWAAVLHVRATNCIWLRTATVTGVANFTAGIASRAGLFSIRTGNLRTARQVRRGSQLQQRVGEACFQALSISLGTSVALSAAMLLVRAAHGVKLRAAAKVAIPKGATGVPIRTLLCATRTDDI